MQNGDSLVKEAYARLAGSGNDTRIPAAAQLLLAIFDDFYSLLCEYPYRAKCAFETGDPHASIRISKERLELYSRYIAEHGPRMRAAFPALADDSRTWDALDRLFVAMIVDRYEADIAFSFAHSMRRNISHEIWRPVAYSFPPPSKLRAFSMACRAPRGAGAPARAGPRTHRWRTRGERFANARILRAFQGS